MQMTMLNTLPTTHPIYQLLAPQSKFAIPFDNVLLALWSNIAPPTSIVSANEFLGLSNEYAQGRSYFDDDPRTTLKALRLRQADFTRKSSWDQYPVVQRLLQVWDLVGAYAEISSAGRIPPTGRSPAITLYGHGSLRRLRAAVAMSVGCRR